MKVSVTRLQITHLDASYFPTLAEIRLGCGSHAGRSDGTCAMEAVAWLAGLPHSAAPSCTCDIVGTYVRAINDRMDDDTRQRLKPLLQRLIGTNDESQRERRTHLLCHCALRQFLPDALEAINLTDHARIYRMSDDLNALAESGRDALCQANDLAWAELERQDLTQLESVDQVSAPVWAVIEASRAAVTLIQHLASPGDDALDLQATAAAEIIAWSAWPHPSTWTNALQLLDQLLRHERPRRRA